MINIAICDDDAVELKKAKDFTLKYEEENGGSLFSISVFSSPEELLEAINKNSLYDIYILDIVMNQMKGIDLAKCIKEKYDVGEFIFMTSSKDYAVDAFALNAIHYIVKPYDKKNFFEALERATRKVSSDGNKYIIRNTDKGLTKILLKNMCYSEAAGHYQYIHMFNNEILKVRSKTLELWDELQNYPQFIKPHSGYIINMDYIKNVTSYGISIQEVNIPLTKNTYNKIKKTYMDYIFNVEKE